MEWDKLSIADRSVFGLSVQNSGMILTSDGNLREVAKEAQLVKHGLLWVFDQMVRHKTISAQEAKWAGDKVFSTNQIYRNNRKLIQAWKRMKKHW